MPEILSRFLKASAAVAPMILAVNPSVLARDNAPSPIPMIDTDLLNEARTVLLGDMQTIYNVPDDIVARYTSDIFDQDFLERNSVRNQQQLQEQLIALYPELSTAQLLERFKTDDLFLAQALIAASETIEPTSGASPALSAQDKVSQYIGRFYRAELLENKLRNPFGFFNLAETDNLSLQTPYAAVTAQQLAPFRTLAEGAEAPTIAMLPPTPKNVEFMKDALVWEALNYETQAQWQAGYDILAGLGANVIVLDAEGTQGGVRVSGDLEYFVRDEAFVFPDVKMAFYPWKAISVGLNRTAEVLEEHHDVIHDMAAAPYRAMMEEQGFELLPIASVTQGGDFLVHPTEKFALLADNNEDNIEDIIQMLEEKTGYDVLVVPKLRKDHYYHLDTFTMVLPHGEIMIYPHATTQEFMDELTGRVGADNIIRLETADAQAAVTNLMSVGDTLVMPAASPELTAQLQERGYKVVTPASFPENNISFYTHQRGYLHCQTQELSFSP